MKRFDDSDMFGRPVNDIFGRPVNEKTWKGTTNNEKSFADKAGARPVSPLGTPEAETYSRLPSDNAARTVPSNSLRPLVPRNMSLADVDDPSVTRIDVHRLISMSRIQRFMILRLERTLKMQRLWIESGASLNSAEPWKGRLIAKAVFSALRDCIDADVLNEGQELLRCWLR